MTDMSMPDKGGIATLAVSFLSWGLNKLSITDINDFFIMLTAFGGFIWMVFKAATQFEKWKTEKYKNKQTRLEMEDREKEEKL